MAGVSIRKHLKRGSCLGRDARERIDVVGTVGDDAGEGLQILRELTLRVLGGDGIEPPRLAVEIDMAAAGLLGSG